jgi:phosphatidate cytidylyltransferase
MKRVATAAVLIPLVLFSVYRLHTVYLSWLIGVVAILAAREYFDIIANFRVRPIRWPIFVLLAFSFFMAEGAMNQTSIRELSLGFTLLALLGLMCVAMRYDDLREGTVSAALSGFAYPYIGLSLLCVVATHQAFRGWFFVVFLFLAVWVGDTAAYYVGRSIGRHKLAPTISPKKTWEGAVASAVFSALVVALWAQYRAPAQREFQDIGIVIGGMELRPSAKQYLEALYQGMTPFLAAIVGLIINVAAQFGDLFESMIKRGAGVKDSGTILPGHGGILDRIDALLFAAPVALLLFTLLDRFLPALK